MCLCTHHCETASTLCVLCEREVKQRKQGAAGAAVPQLRLCSQRSLHAVLSEPDEEITGSLEKQHHVFHFSILSVSVWILYHMYFVLSLARFYSGITFVLRFHLQANLRKKSPN